MQLKPTNEPNFSEILRAQRALGKDSIPDTPELSQWLKYWNDDESYAMNMRNLGHWINCARAQAA